MTWSQYTRARELLSWERFGLPRKLMLEAEQAQFEMTVAKVRADADPEPKVKGE